MEGGLGMPAWFKLWENSYAVSQMGVWRIAWPDGLSTLEQPAITVAMFDLIKNMLMEARDSDG